MKKQILTLALALMVTLGISSTGWSADSVKIGIINFEKIMQESSAGKLGQQELKKKGEALKAKLEAEKDNLEKIRKGFEREFLVLSPEKKKEKERDFRIRVNDFNRMKNDAANELKSLEISLVNKMQKSVFLIAKEVGEKAGYTLILEKKNAGVIFMDSTVDLTDRVIKTYNAQQAKAAN